MNDGPEVLWELPPAAAATTHMGRWMAWLRAERGIELDDYEAAWRWSVEDLDGFWDAVWDHFAVIGDRPAGAPVLGSRQMPGASWFPGTTLNWAENMLARVPRGTAVVSVSQTRERREHTGAELRAEVARVRAGLQRLGVARGDRVAAYLPNGHEAVSLALATASLGAVFTSCPPEFGARGVIDRFGQVEPTMLVAADGYRHKGRALDRRSTVAEIWAGLPSLRSVVVLPYLDELTPDGTVLDGALSWGDLVAEEGDLAFAHVPFDHPLFILYSSGTTGPPKAIVHGHGGVLVEMVKLHHLHHDLGPDDRFFWFSTTGWVMWNYLVSSLVTGTSIVLFDGDPGHPDLDVLWDMAAAEGVTVFGASAPFFLACRKAGLAPGAHRDLSALRQVGSTGAPLPAEGFRWVYESVGPDLQVVSASGGTDVCTAFVAGSPLVPVVAGEIACRCLGVRVEAFDEKGRSVVGEQGELVVTAPMPSMPVGLWGDDDGRRLRATYFERFPGVWAHGDWITLTDRGTCIVSGRSDATLNRGGVRLGTSDFYSVVDALDEVADSLVVHLEDPEGGVGELLLFVQLVGNGAKVPPAVVEEIAGRLRSQLSPRHVPDAVLAVPAVPRTLSGKRLEVPVKRILQGQPAAAVANTASLADPLALDAFVSLAAERATD